MESSASARLSQNQKSTRKAFLSKKRRDALIAYSFIAPNFIGFAVFTLVPVLFAFVLAFMKWDGVNPMKWIAFGNFTRLLRDKNFIDAFFHTIVYVLFNVPLMLVFSLFLALLLNSNIVGRNFFRTISFFPYVASLVAVAAVWNFLFNPSMGPVNQLLLHIGAAPRSLPKWAAGKDTAMMTVIMFSIWKNMGYYMVIFLAGLQNVNTELYEAASLDGANRRQQFFHVTLPQLSPTTFFVTMMVLIQSFKVYNEVYMITQGGPGTSTLVLVYQIYNEAFVGPPEYGYASAISMVLFVLVLLMTLLQFRSEKKIA